LEYSVACINFYSTCIALNFHPNMQTQKKTTLIIHTVNYSGPLQVIIKHSADNWELVWPTLIRQNSVDSALMRMEAAHCVLVIFSFDPFGVNQECECLTLPQLTLSYECENRRVKCRWESLKAV
jgi:hypothetical protein